jgi:hypothetical protein
VSKRCDASGNNLEKGEGMFDFIRVFMCVFKYPRHSVALGCTMNSNLCSMDFRLLVCTTFIKESEGEERSVLQVGLEK